MTSQAARSIQLITHDGGSAQAARSIVLAPYVEAEPPAPDPIPPANLNSGGIGMRWQVAERIDRASSDAWGDAPVVHIGVDLRHQDADQKDRFAGQLWGSLAQRERLYYGPWADLVAHADAGNGVSYAAPPPVDLPHKGLWADFGSRIDPSAGFDYNAPPPVDRLSNHAFFSNDPYGQQHQGWEYRPPQVVGGALVLNAELPGNYTAPAFDQVDFDLIAERVQSARANQPKHSSTHLPHNAPPVIHTGRTVNWGWGSWTRPRPDSYINVDWVVEPPEEPPRPTAPPILEVYLFMSSITIITDPEGQEVEALNATLALDRDTWAWRISATLATKADLDLVRPDSNGPKDILITINGHQWSGMVESYGRSRAFGSEGWAIKARSHSAILASPYAPKKSQVITTDYSAAQLADLSVSGTGWTVDWQAPDWIVKGGAWAFQDLDPIQQVGRLATAVGAVVRPDQNDKRLDIISRYPVSPHLWGGAALDAILPESLILDMAGSWKPATAYNRAIVAGSQVGGVLINATRNGTAGDLMAPQVVDPLITHTTAGQERARIEMDKGGNREILNITTMLDTNGGSGPQLYLPQHLIEVQEDEAWRGLVGSTEIEAINSEEKLTVRQKIKVERYHG